MPSLALACRLSAVSMALRRAFPGAFDPASLFAAGEQGLWYDIGDFDRYMATGEELAISPSKFSQAHGFYTFTDANTISCMVDGEGSWKECFFNGLTIGKRYRMRFDLIRHYGAAQILLGSPIGSYFWQSGQAASQYFVDVTFEAKSTYIQFVAQAQQLFTFDNISVRELTAIDTATLFQDAAGTTPVTAVEQPVGLILDKSKGLVLGPELVTNGDFSNGTTGWQAVQISGTATIAENAGRCDVNLVSGYNLGLQTANNILTAGKWYEIRFNYIKGSYPGSSLSIGAASEYTLPVLNGGNVGRFFATSTGKLVIRSIGAWTVSAGLLFSIDNISVRELPGNHASQATTTARGVLRARYNLLTYSEDFGNPAWVKSGSPTLTNLGAGVWRLQASAGSTWLLYQNIPRPTAESCKFTIEVKSNGGGSNFRTMQKGLYNTSVTATTEWTRISTTPGPNDGSGAVGIVFDAANSEIDILIRFPDLRPANLPANLPPYQRIAAATDYDTVGFPVYVDIDGTDDNYVTGSINFTATDKMTIWAGLRKVDDTARMLCELSANPAIYTGSFFLVTGDDVTSSYSSLGYGNATISLSQRSLFPLSPPYLAPDHAVITATHDISGDLSRIRRNGSSAGAIDGTGDKGAGNFGNYPLYLFSRAGTSLRWKGQFYGLIIRGAATDTTQLEQTEQWLNAKMGGIY